MTPEDKVSIALRPGAGISVLLAGIEAGFEIMHYSAIATLLRRYAEIMEFNGVAYDFPGSYYQKTFYRMSFYSQMGEPDK